MQQSERIQDFLLKLESVYNDLEEVGVKTTDSDKNIKLFTSLPASYGPLITALSV